MTVFHLLFLRRMPAAAARRGGVEALYLLTLAVVCVSGELSRVSPAFAVSGIVHTLAARCWPRASAPRGAALGLTTRSGGGGTVVRSHAPGLSLNMLDYSVGDRVLAKGNVGTLTAYKSSWWTVTLDDGGVVKARKKDLARVAGSSAASNAPDAPGAAVPRAAPARAKAPADKSSNTAPVRKGSATSSRKGSATAKRKPAAAKVAAKPADQPRPATVAPPKQAMISRALQRISDLTEETGAVDDDVSVSYPEGLATVLDGMDSSASGGAETTALAGGKSSAQKGATKTVAYPDPLQRVLELVPGQEPASTSTGAPEAQVPAALAPVLTAMATGAQPGSTTTVASKGTGTKKRAPGSKTVQRGRKMSPTGAASKVVYPSPLARYLELSASTSTAADRQAQKPERAVYPPVLASMLSLMASPPRAPASRKGTGTATAAKRAAESLRKSPSAPTSAVYPRVLAQLLDLTESTGATSAAISAEDAVFLAKYPAPLAEYLDLLEASGVPPLTAPPKRAVYPKVLADALGMGVNLDGSPPTSDVTSQLLSEAQMPTALADMMDATEMSAVEPIVGTPERVPVPTMAEYPAALATLLELTAGPSWASRDLPVSYPATFAELYLDAVETSSSSAVGGTKMQVDIPGSAQRDNAGGSASGEQVGGESSKTPDVPEMGSIFSKFDEIARKFGEKFGL